VEIKGIKEKSVLTIYLDEINKIPLLSRQEEREYAMRAARGDSQAKDVLMKANLRFVVRIAKRYRNHGMPLEDLISEGNLGLMKAIERFDVEKGYHFISYAVWWIRQAVLKAVSEGSSLIRLPLHRAYERYQSERWDDQPGDSPSTQEGSGGRSPKRAAELRLLSLDAPTGGEPNSSQLVEIVEDDRYKPLEDMAIDSCLKDDILAQLKVLSEKEKDIIQRRFGLNGNNPTSLKAIASRYELTKERIRQIEKAALRRLRHAPRSGQLKEYIA
jgi:RNA polymerase primary sigma factor